MSPPGNATAPPLTLSQLTLRQSADGYPAIDPSQYKNAFRNRVALITGSSRGIGKAMAKAFTEAGYSVAITARNAAEVEETTVELQREYHTVKVIGVVADVTNLKGLEKLVVEVNEKLGTIDVLLCNAGTNTFLPFTMTTASDWWSSLEINLKAPTELTRLVLPQMRERNSGTIIYTSSRAAVADLPWTTAYGCGKTALTRFAACLQGELDQTQTRDYGVQSNGTSIPRSVKATADRSGISLYSIHPGEVETRLHTTGFPEQTHRDAPYIIEHMRALDQKRPKFESSLAAWTSVYLASGKADPVLRGKYVDCTRDVQEYEVLLNAMKTL